MRGPAVLSVVRRRGATEHLLQCRSIATSTAGNGDQAAIIYDSPVTGTIARYQPSRLDSKDLTAHLAGALAGLRRNGKGDRVIIYMPMVPEAAIAMLACARIGAVHSVVFGGFAAQRAGDADRRRQAESHHLSASCGIEPGRVVAYKPLLDEAIELAAHKPEALHHPAARQEQPPR